MLSTGSCPARVAHRESIAAMQETKHWSVAAKPVVTRRLLVAAPGYSHPI
jgi:hypothetical protein